MNETDSADDLEVLNAVLDEERAALLAGQIEEIARLAKEKDAVLTRLGDRRKIPLEGIERLQTKINQNQGLYESALDGIRAAAARIEDMRRVRQVLSTYDRQGLMREIKMKGARQVERRA